ncbi:MAG: caspase family protein [Desulfobacterales bacterium]|nr:caspase family protein [Desulfobacterales bacterium]
MRFRSFFCVFLTILLASCMTATPNLHVVVGETRMSLTQSAPIARGADISPDGKYLLTGGMDGFTYWDISRGVLISRYSAKLPQIMGTLLTTGLIPVAFASGGRHALSGGEELNLWDLSSGRLIRKIGNDPAESIGVSADGKRVLICDPAEFTFREDKMVLYDARSGAKIAEWNAGHGGGIIALSPDGNYAMSTGGGGRKAVEADRGTISLWDVSRGALVRTFAGTGANKGLGHAVLAMAFSANGKYALSGGTDGSVRLWDIASGVELKTIQGHAGSVGTKAVAFSPDGRWIHSVGGSDGLAKLWDISSGSLFRAFKVSDDRFVDIRRFGGIVNGWVSFTPDSKRIIFMGSDASFRIFDVTTGDEIATLVLFDDGEWLVVAPEGYYNASSKGAQYLKVNYEGRDYSVDQFYDVFYRPDIVAAKLRGDDIKDLITITMKDAAKSPPPVVDISPVSVSAASPTAKVCYQINSTGGGIGEVRLFHNGKLIESDGYYKDIVRTTSEKTQLATLNSRAIYADMRSIKINEKVDIGPVSAGSKGEVFKDCREIEAVSGENEISVTAFNRENTVQGYMKTAKFNARIAGEEPRLYILTIGIDRYKDDTINLKYAVKDSNDIEERLVKQAETLYPSRNIHRTVLANADATRSNITDTIGSLSKQIRPNDSFIFFAAGHGILLQNQYYMLTHDYDGMIRPDAMLSSNEIVEMSKKIKSLSQLLIFDTCHAGGIDYIVSGLYDARMSVLAKKMGLHLYASANSKEAALDGYRGNGLFTHTLLDGLSNKQAADRNQDGAVSLTELGVYSKQATTDISKTIGHPQTPLIINFGKDSPVYRLK